MDFWKLYIVALTPVLKVLFIAAVGAFLAHDRFDILRGNARKHLNTVVHAIKCSSKIFIGAALGWLGHIHAWSIVYNIVRIYSRKNNDKSHPNDIMDQLESECKVPDEQAKVPEKPNIMKQLKILADKINLKVLFAPSSVGAIIGLIIGVVPLFRKLLIGDNAPFRVVKDSVATLGEACIPAMILLIGSHLVKGLKGFKKQLPLVVGILVIEFIVLPAIGIGIIKGAVHYNLIQPDPLYQFVLLLHYALPPAVLLSTMIQLLGVGESECSVIMVATYSCSAVLLTVWCTIFLWLVL
ncbi:Membrane transport protein [Sesbania bispinosa]|nr:Membrane transport protein [Sesbania bispinosa]